MDAYLLGRQRSRRLKMRQSEIGGVSSPCAHSNAVTPVFYKQFRPVGPA